MSYRQFSIVALIIVAISCFSCNIQKRLYRNGFYWNKSENMRSVQSNEKDTTQKFNCREPSVISDSRTDSTAVVVQTPIDTFEHTEEQAIPHRVNQPATILKGEQRAPKQFFSPRATEWRYLGQALLISIVTFVLILLLATAPGSLAWVCIIGVSLTAIAVLLAIRLHYKNKGKQDPKPGFSILKFLARLFLYLAIAFFTTMNVVFGITMGEL